MNVVLFLLLTSVVAGTAAYVLVTAGVRWARLRGTRVVTCPETKEPAAVALASLSGLFGGRAPSLRACSRWPERRGCGQECLAEIAAAPDGCLLRELAERFYTGKCCVLCGHPFPPGLSALEHSPGLLARDGTTALLGDMRAEKVPAAFGTHEPVCWSCHMVRSLARKRPELVVVRPPHPDPQQLP